MFIWILKKSITLNSLSLFNFMEKITRIEGTRYVKIGDNIFNTVSKDVKMKTICECLFCGERFAANAAGQCAIYCKYCKTIASRKANTAENKKIFTEAGLSFN